MRQFRGSIFPPTSDTKSMAGAHTTFIHGRATARQLPLLVVHAGEKIRDVQDGSVPALGAQANAVILPNKHDFDLALLALLRTTKSESVARVSTRRGHITGPSDLAS